MIKTKQMMVLDNSHRITVTNLLTGNQSDGGDTNNPELLTLNQRTGTDALGDTTGFLSIIPEDDTSLESSSTEAHSGNKSLKVTTAGIQANEGIVLSPGVTVTNSTTYVCGCWVKSDAVGRTIRLTASSGLTGQNFTITGEWQYLEITGTTSTSFYPHIKNPNNDGAMTFYVDDLRLAKTDTTGFTAEIGTETLTITGEESHQGYRSCKVVTAATANSGFKTTATTATAGTTYTKQVRVKATAGKAMKLHLRNNDGSAIASTSFTATGGWDLVTVSGAPKTGATGVVCAVTNDSAEAVTFKTDTASLETGSTAHDWIIGQGSYSFFRSRE